MDFKNYKTDYFILPDGSVCTDSVCDFMRKARDLLYQIPTLTDSHITLFRLKTERYTVLLQADRDYFSLCLKDGQQTRTLRRWQSCSPFELMTKAAFEHWVLELIQDFETKTA